VVRRHRGGVRTARRRPLPPRQLSPSRTSAWQGGVRDGSRESWGVSRPNAPCPLATLAAILATAALAVGCTGGGVTHPNSAAQRGGDRSGTATAPVAAAGSALRPPGSPLDGSLRVQAGSQLVATAFPYDAPRFDAAATSEDMGAWQSLLIVDGNPIEVWDRYARALGIDDWGSARHACVVRRVPAPGERPPTTIVGPTTTAAVGPPSGVPPPGVGGAPAGPTVQELPFPERLHVDPQLDCEEVLACEAQGLHVSMVMRFGATLLCPGGDTSSPRCERWRDRHLYLTVAPNVAVEPGDVAVSRTVGGAGLASDGRPTSGPIVPPRIEATGTVSSLPGPGDRFDAGLDGYLAGSRVVDLPPGARSLVAPSMPIECNSGLVAALEVPGAPPDALRTFDDADPTDRPMYVTALRWKGRSALHGVISTAGGYALDLTAVASGGDSSDVLITECAD
jgi:hypothetical protein